MKTHRQIIEKYGETVPKTTRGRRTKATRLLNERFCRCIKKADTDGNHGRAIALCTRSIFTRRGFKRGSFTCKKRKDKLNWKIQGRKTNKTKKR